MKEKYPRNSIKTLYRINPRLNEEATITLVNSNNKKTHKKKDFKELLCSTLLSTKKANS